MRVEHHVRESLLSQLRIHDEYEARCWARMLGVSRDEVVAAFGVASQPQAEAGGACGFAPGSVCEGQGGPAQQG